MMKFNNSRLNSVAGNMSIVMRQDFSQSNNDNRLKELDISQQSSALFRKSNIQISKQAEETSE